MATYTANLDAGVPQRDPQPHAASRQSRKARTRALVALAVALLAGIGASWMIVRAIGNRPTEMVAVPVKKVVVAKVELPLATTLAVEMLDVAEWPVAVAPEGSVDDPQLLVGRVLKSAVVPGDPIVEARLAEKNAGAGLAAMIPKDARAMTVRVNEASGVAGFIHPGDLVDVIATMQVEGAGTEVRSRIVLQNIRVLAVGQKLEAPGTAPIQVPVVTLLVTPAESERLALASTQGQLQLTMRSGIDQTSVETEGVSAKELLEGGDLLATATVRAGATGDERRASRDAGKRRHETRVTAPPAPVVAAAREAPKEEVVEIIRGPKVEQRKLKVQNSAEGGK